MANADVDSLMLNEVIRKSKREDSRRELINGKCSTLFGFCNAITGALAGLYLFMVRTISVPVTFSLLYLVGVVLLLLSALLALYNAGVHKYVQPSMGRGLSPEQEVKLFTEGRACLSTKDVYGRLFETYAECWKSNYSTNNRRATLLALSFLLIFLGIFSMLASVLSFFI